MNIHSFPGLLGDPEHPEHLGIKRIGGSATVNREGIAKEAQVTSEIRYEDKPWLRNYEKGVPERVDFENVCLPAFLDQTAAAFPDQMALSFQGYTITYRQLKEMVDRAAAALSAMGIGPGDRVAILLPNLIPCVAAYYAILRIGAVAVMNNPLYSDRELDHQFNDSESKALITLDLLGNRMIDLRPGQRFGKSSSPPSATTCPFPRICSFLLWESGKNWRPTSSPPKRCIGGSSGSEALRPPLRRLP